MGVKVPQEMCSFCGAITKGSLANRCDHLRFEMHQQKSNGQVVYAINIPPMNFFDISIVRKPADAQGHSLFQKVASEEDSHQDKIATLVKRIEAIDALPSAVSIDEMDKFRKSFSPETIVKIVKAKELQFKPSEALFIGSNMDKEDYPDCEKHCNTEAFIKILLEKADKAPPCAIMKTAGSMDYSNSFIDKIIARGDLIKEAASNFSSSGFFGNPNSARNKVGGRVSLKKADYSRYRVNFVDGKSVTISKTGFGLSRDVPGYYVDLVDDGFASSITGIRANGDEALLYTGDR
jgi:hypothetical protein